MSLHETLGRDLKQHTHPGWCVRADAKYAIEVNDAWSINAGTQTLRHIIVHIFYSGPESQNPN